MIAAVLDEIPDQPAIAPGEAPLVGAAAIHPFLAQRHDADPFGIGGVIAFDHPLHRPPHLRVCRIGEMCLQEFAENLILLQLAEKALQFGLMRVRLTLRELSVLCRP